MGGLLLLTLPLSRPRAVCANVTAAKRLSRGAARVCLSRGAAGGARVCVSRGAVVLSVARNLFAPHVCKALLGAALLVAGRGMAASRRGHAHGPRAALQDHAGRAPRRSRAASARPRCVSKNLGW